MSEAFLILPPAVLLRLALEDPQHSRSVKLCIMEPETELSGQYCCTEYCSQVSSPKHYLGTPPIAPKLRLSLGQQKVESKYNVVLKNRRESAK